MLALVLVAGVSPAVAAPTVSDKRDEAIRVKKQADDLDARVEVASEAYNEAYAKHAKLVSQIGSTQAKLKKTNKRIDKLQTMLSTRANSMYRNGPLSIVEVLLGANDFEELAATWDLLTDINRKDADATVELKAAKAEAEKTAKDLASREREAKTTLGQMASKKQSIENQLAERKRMLVGLESEIAAIEAAERARAAAAAAVVVSRSRSYETQRSFPAPTRAARSEVVDVAKRYLGAPYRWGASGPNSFDCSGFTMFVYAQVGVSLPHSSRAQIGYGERVSRSDLQAGDLVFFGSPIHHVGIYVGGGMYIHAPHTGDVVSISPLTRGDYAGACRP